MESSADQSRRAAFDHEASPEEMATVEAHLGECAACAARLERYRRLAPRLDADTRALLVDAPTRATSGHRLNPRQAFSARLPPGVPGARLVSVALLIGVAAVLWLAMLRPALSGGSQSSAAQPKPPIDPSPASLAQQTAPPAEVVLVSLDGVVDAATASYVRRAVATAEQRRAVALVVSLDTSGGLETPVRDIVRDLSTSDVPTLAYIAPGARVDSAGALIGDAGGLLAAAGPTSSGSDRPTDLVANTVSALLRAADGREVQTPDGRVTLTTADAALQPVDMTPTEIVMHRLFDPTLAYLLFVIGLYAVLVELAHPGALVPGITGLVCLGLALVAFATLPINWIGLMLLVAAVALIALDVKVTAHGGLAFGGVVCLVIGSLLLYARAADSSHSLPDVAIALPVVAAVAVGGVALGLALTRVAASVRRLPPALSLEQLTGARGTTRTPLNPEGVVHLQGQLWSARLRSGQLEAGQPIRVVARHGLVLEVESSTFRGAATQKGTSR